MNKIIQSNTQQSLTSSYQLHVDRRAPMSCYRDCMTLPLPLSLSIPASFTRPSNQFQRRTGSCTLVLASRLNNHHRKSHRHCKALIFTCGLCVRAHACVELALSCCLIKKTHIYLGTFSTAGKLQTCSFQILHHLVVPSKV